MTTMPRYGCEKERRENLNLQTVSLEDCLDNYKFKDKRAIINDGKLIGFKKEEIPTQTANPSGDK